MAMKVVENTINRWYIRRQSIILQDYFRVGNCWHRLLSYRKEFRDTIYGGTIEFDRFDLDPTKLSMLINFASRRIDFTAASLQRLSARN